MKKLIISAVCLLALAAGVSSYAYYRSHQIVAKNSLAKANVEALTDNENPNCYSCFKTVVDITPGDPLYNHAFAVHLCTDCEWHMVIDHSSEFGECWK